MTLKKSFQLLLMKLPRGFELRICDFQDQYHRPLNLIDEKQFHKISKSSYCDVAS